MSDEDVWFEPKRFGYGAGLPVRWQGWALVAGFVGVALLLSAVFAHRQPILLMVSLVLASIPLIVISARHTRGGWRWRWGGKE